MLVVNRNDWQSLLVPDMTGQRLEVSDDQIDLPLVDDFFEPDKTSGRLWDGDEIFGDRPFIAYPIVHIGKTETVNFGNVKLWAEIAQTTIEGRDMNSVSLRGEVRKHFPRPGRVPCAFAVDSIEDIGHGPKGLSIPRKQCSREEVGRVLSMNDCAAEN
jgi:hypothetical protein